MGDDYHFGETVKRVQAALDDARLMMKLGVISQAFNTAHGIASVARLILDDVNMVEAVASLDAIHTDLWNIESKTG